MANRVRGEIDAKIDGKTRTLCLTLGALAELEHDLGVADLQGIGEQLASGRISTRHILLILKAGLKGGGLDIAVDQLAQAEIEGGVRGAVRLVADLLTATFGDAE